MFCFTLARYTGNEVASVIKGNKVRKKGLQQGARYFFSVKPVGGGENAFSAASLPAVIPSLSAFMSRMLPNQILSKATQGLVSTSETLAGKVVGIYFSAHWCGPCRNFTPQLAQLYNECKRLGKDFEVLFCSADSDEDEFLGYFQKEMPWYAVPYDDPTREQIQSTFQVNGIPKLSILAPSGRFIVENAAGQALSPSTVDAWIQRAASM
jgi:nucleoredoxin